MKIQKPKTPATTTYYFIKTDLHRTDCRPLILQRHHDNPAVVPSTSTTCMLRSSPNTTTTDALVRDQNYKYWTCSSLFFFPPHLKRTLHVPMYGYSPQHCCYTVYSTPLAVILMAREYIKPYIMIRVGRPLEKTPRRCSRLSLAFTAECLHSGASKKQEKKPNTKTQKKRYNSKKNNQPKPYICQYTYTHTQKKCDSTPHSAIIIVRI